MLTKLTRITISFYDVLLTECCALHWLQHASYPVLLTPAMRAEVKAWIAFTLAAAPLLGFLAFFAGPRVFHKFLIIIPLALPLALLALIFGLTAFRELRARASKTIALAAVLMALALPLLFAWSFSQRSQLFVNEQRTALAMRRMNTALYAYADRYQHGFPQTLAALGPPGPGRDPDANHAGLMDAATASGQLSGYTLRYEASGDPKRPSGYILRASPLQVEVTGVRNFYLDESGRLRAERDRQADKTSPLY